MESFECESHRKALTSTGILSTVATPRGNGSDTTVCGISYIERGSQRVLLLVQQAHLCLQLRQFDQLPNQGSLESGQAYTIQCAPDDLSYSHEKQRRKYRINFVRERTPSVLPRSLTSSTSGSYESTACRANITSETPRS